MDKGEKLKEMKNSEEQGSRVILRNESFKLTHRKSNSNNNSSNSISGISSSSHSTQNGNDCDNNVNHLFSKFKHSNKLICSKSGLLQNKTAVRRWKILATVVRGWWGFVTSKTSTQEHDNKLLNCPVNYNEQHSSPLEVHIIDIAHDVESKFSPNHEAEPRAAPVVASAGIESIPASQDHGNFSCGRAARLVLKRHHFIQKATPKMIRSWVFFKWVFRVLNVLIEVGQAILTQVNGQRKLSNPCYQRLSVMISFICLVISLVEIIGEGKMSRVVWQRKGGCCWFYYPGTQRRLFGKFSLYFGVVSSTIQFLINSITLMINNRFIKFESLPPLLSFGHLVAAMADPGEQLMVKCRIHGNCIVHCPHCDDNTSTLSS